MTLSEYHLTFQPSKINSCIAAPKWESPELIRIQHRSNAAHCTQISIPHQNLAGAGGLASSLLSPGHILAVLPDLLPEAAVAAEGPLHQLAALDSVPDGLCQLCSLLRVQAGHPAWLSCPPSASHLRRKTVMNCGASNKTDSSCFPGRICWAFKLFFAPVHVRLVLMRAMLGVIGHVGDT